MNFLVTYSDPDELLADHTEQFLRSGFLVRVDPPPGLALYAEVLLTLAFADEEATLEAKVVQVLPGMGVAVSFEDQAALESLVELARARTGGGGRPAVHACELEAPRSTSGAAGSGPSDPAARAPSRAEKIRMARRGDRADRDAILRDTDRSLQRFLLINPGLTLGEVKNMAAMPISTTPTLKTIGERREWFSRPEIAMALLRNPRTPIPIAIRMIPLVNLGELKALTRAGHLRTPILKVARKRI